MLAVGAAMATEKGGHRVVITADDLRIETPPIEHLVFYAGLGVLAAIEIIEWPVALLLTAGHLLADLTNRPGLQGLGEVLEEA
jgi:hypothetical protein